MVLYTYGGGNLCVYTCLLGEYCAIRESGINYVHSVLYTRPEFTARLGLVVPVSIVRSDCEESGDKFTMRLYESIKAADKNLSIFSKIVFENNEWKVMRMSVTGSGLSKELVSNQKWV